MGFELGRRLIREHGAPELEAMRGRELEEDSKICSLGQLIPDEYTRALCGHIDTQSYTGRLLFTKRRLGLEKQKALAPAAVAGGPVAMDLGHIGLGEPGSTEDDDTQLEAALALTQSWMRGRPKGKGEGPSSPTPRGPEAPTP